MVTLVFMKLSYFFVLGYPAQIRYQVRVSGNSSSCSDPVVCQSPPTNPVYVQTKRGGTTAVLQSPVSTPSISKGSSRQSTASCSRSSRSSSVISRRGRGNVNVSGLDARRLGKRALPSGNYSGAALEAASGAHVASTGHSSKKRPRGLLGSGASGAEAIATAAAAGVGAPLFERHSSDGSAGFGSGSNRGVSKERSSTQGRGYGAPEVFESSSSSQALLLESLDALHQKVC